MRLVQKYGGTSVGSLERIRHIAGLVIGAWEQGRHQVAVVVSAMGDETDRLLGMAHALDPRPPAREIDALVSTGEQVSAALLAIELHRRGVPASSFTGSQAGFRTDGAHSRARIRRIESAVLDAALSRGEVPVVTGFQGVDRDGNITTLGRGGSDTSAVALAVALEADRCDIYTDVEGIFTTDPRVVPDARKLERISYEEMLELASLGANVLQTRSVELAMRYRMPVCLRSSFTTSGGTLVTEEDDTMERAVVTGVAFNRDEAKITIRGIPDHPGIAANVLRPISEAGINVDVIVQNVSEQGYTDMTFTVPREDYERTLELMEPLRAQLQAREVLGDPKIGKVSIVGVGMRSHAGVARTMFDALAGAGINIQMITTSEIKITVVVDEDAVDRAVRTLHDAFHLDSEEVRVTC
ncbi:MAG: aspartate kinase [Zetaproteobacteria bacterium]|nr:MAG: aspartate kinase [Zetaproteobacteria bacterium]